MTETGYIIILEGVNDHAAFFSELLAFYAPKEVTLTIWGRLPPIVENSLSRFRAPYSWMRAKLFHQSEWHLNPKSLNVLAQNLCNNELLSGIKWGLIKSGTSLGLSRGWNDINIDGSMLIDGSEIFEWLENLKSKSFIKQYQKAAD